MASVMFVRFFELKISGHGADGVPRWNRTQLGSNAAYHIIYVDVMYYVLCFALPLVSLTFMNWRLILGYRAARRRRSRILQTNAPANSQTADADNPRCSSGSRSRSRTRLVTAGQEQCRGPAMFQRVKVKVADR